MGKTECINCKWWDRLDEGEEKDGCGQCHRNAPLPRLCYDQGEADDTEDICSYKAEWPFTNGRTWCGEFKQKP